MGDLDVYKDKVIVFEAVKTSDTGRLITRQPLQPTNTQLLSPNGSSPELTSIKGSIDRAADENVTPSDMSHGSFPPSKAVHGQALHPGTQSNAQPLSPSLGRVSDAPSSNPHTSGSTFRPSTLQHSSARSSTTPHPGAATPLSTSDDAGGSVNMAGFDRFYDNWYDRTLVSYPDYNYGTHVSALFLVFMIKS